MILAIILGVVGVGAGVTRLGIKIRQNRKAAKAGKPKPYTPGGLVEEALNVLEAGANTAKSVTKR